jgi:hypothetical protein
MKESEYIRLLINMNLESNTKTEKQSNFYKVNLFQGGKKS